MPRLIDADKLKADFIGKRYGTQAIEYVIDQQPTVDAVEVVRCKDCRFHEHEEPGMVWCPNVIGSWIEENGYCSRGERREDAETN